MRSSRSVSPFVAALAFSSLLIGCGHSPPTTALPMDMGRVECPTNPLPPKCTDGMVVQQQGADGCVRPVCQCASPTVFDPVAEACVFGPYVELRACPANQGVNCLVDFTHHAAGTTGEDGFQLFNSGNSTLLVTSVALTSASSARFSVIQGAGAVSIPPNVGIDVSVRYSPVGESVDKGRLVIHSNAVNGDVSADVQGSTDAAPCMQHSDCIVGDHCAAGTCQVCFVLTIPECIGGSVHGETKDGCTNPVCECPSGKMLVGNTCM